MCYSIFLVPDGLTPWVSPRTLGLSLGFHSIARATCTYCRPHPHFVASSWHLGIVRGGNVYSTGIGIMLQMNAFQGSFSTLRSLPLAQQAEAVEDGNSKRSLQSELWSEPCPLEATSACRQYSPNSKPLHFFFLQCFSLLIPPGHCSSPLQSGSLLSRLSFPKPPCLTSLLPPPVLVTLEKNTVSP